MSYQTIKVVRVREEAPYLQPKDLYTLMEAAELLHASPSNLQNLLDRGVLTAVEDDHKAVHLKSAPPLYLLRCEIDALLNDNGNGNSNGQNHGEQDYDTGC
jgi:hypothetical protein